MGVCASKSQADTVTLPTQQPQHKEMRSIAKKLVEMRKLDEAPVLSIASSKMYQKRKEWKQRSNGGETTSSWMVKCEEGSLLAI